MHLISGLRHSVASALVSVGLCLAASQSQAVVIWSGPVSLAVPATNSGLWLNIVTGATGSSSVSVPDWDINLWGPEGLGFFGSFVLSSPTTTANLAIGAPIGATSSFGSQSTLPFAQWNLNSSDNYVGFRLLNRPNSAPVFGWAQLAIGATIGQRSIVGYAYENVPTTAILAGSIPEPSSYLLMTVGLISLVWATRRCRLA